MTAAATVDEPLSGARRFEKGRQNLNAVGVILDKTRSTTQRQKAHRGSFIMHSFAHSDGRQSVVSLESIIASLWLCNQYHYHT